MYSENLLRPPSEAGPTDEQAYEAKLGELARVIGEIGPDVGDFPEDLRPVQVDDDGSTIAGMGAVR